MCSTFVCFFAVSFSLLNIVTPFSPCLPSVLRSIAIWTRKPSRGNYKTSHYVSYSLLNFQGIPGVLRATFSECFNLICCKILVSWTEEVLNWVGRRSRDSCLNMLWKLLYFLIRKTESCGWTWACPVKQQCLQRSLSWCLVTTMTTDSIKDQYDLLGIFLDSLSDA